MYVFQDLRVWHKGDHFYSDSIAGQQKGTPKGDC